MLADAYNGKLCWCVLVINYLHYFFLPDSRVCFMVFFLCKYKTVWDIRVLSDGLCRYVWNGSTCLWNAEQNLSILRSEFRVKLFSGVKWLQSYEHSVKWVKIKNYYTKKTFIMKSCIETDENHHEKLHVCTKETINLAIQWIDQN